MRTERSSDSPDPEPDVAPGPDHYAGLPVSAFLDALAGRAAAPAGGSAVALVVAQAAALCAKAARLSSRQLGAERAAGLTSEAERIRAAAAALIDEDPRAYAAVIEQHRRAAAAHTQAGAGRRDRSASPGPAEVEHALAAALSNASDVPMRLVELAAGVADLGAALAADGNPALRGDAIAAALLAQAAARSASTLVSINLAAAPEDARHARAAGLLTVIARSVDSAVR